MWLRSKEKARGAGLEPPPLCPSLFPAGGSASVCSCCSPHPGNRGHHSCLGSEGFPAAECPVLTRLTEPHGGRPTLPWQRRPEQSVLATAPCFPSLACLLRLTRGEKQHRSRGLNTTRYGRSKPRQKNPLTWVCHATTHVRKPHTEKPFALSYHQLCRPTVLLSAPGKAPGMTSGMICTT